MTVTTPHGGGLSTRELAAHLNVTYRQLDHLARQHGPDGRDLAGARGSGAGRTRWWTPELVARLEVATALAQASGHLWGNVAAAIVTADEEPPRSGWVLLDDLGDVYYVTSERGVARLLARGNGGITARYALSTNI